MEKRFINSIVETSQKNEVEDVDFLINSSSWERLKEGSFVTCVGASETECLQHIIQEGNRETSKNKGKLYGFLHFLKNDEALNNVYLTELVTLWVVFQCDLRCIRDGAGEEWNMANFERNPTPFRSIFGNKNDCENVVFQFWRGRNRFENE